MTTSKIYKDAYTGLELGIKLLADTIHITKEGGYHLRLSIFSKKSAYFKRLGRTLESDGIEHSVAMQITNDLIDIIMELRTSSPYWEKGVTSYANLDNYVMLQCKNKVIIKDTRDVNYVKTFSNADLSLFIKLLKGELSDEDTLVEVRNNPLVKFFSNVLLGDMFAIVKQYEIEVEE